MNIVHITNLSNNKASGIANIVPLHIKWQSKLVNLCWYNLSTKYSPPEDLKELYVGIGDTRKLSIHSLPNKFSTPDLVIFHGIFFYQYYRLAKQLNKMGIKYIVVPHGSLTNSAIRQKAVKKYLGFKLIFGQFLKKAEAIQYLTEGEHQASGSQWNRNHIIVPNGCEKPLRCKTKFRSLGIVGVFIGRKSIYYKGLDLLIEACYTLKHYLEHNKCIIYIYGPEEDRADEKLQALIDQYSLNQYIKLGQSVYSEQKEKVLLDSDFFILTSRTEGHPVALIEALSYGLPCLVTPGTNMAKEIMEYDAGWVADKAGIAQTLKELLDNRAQLKSKGYNASTLSTKYEWSRIAIETINRYKEL